MEFSLQMQIVGLRDVRSERKDTISHTPYFNFRIVVMTDRNVPLRFQGYHSWGCGFLVSAIDYHSPGSCIL